jgi:hypothetical protein
VHATPWGLSGNFVAAMREGRGRLALAGPGDPTGRGAGFSFLRDDRKVSLHRLLRSNPISPGYEASNSVWEDAPNPNPQAVNTAPARATPLSAVAGFSSCATTAR